jgi:hypothetical protein
MRCFFGERLHPFEFLFETTRKIVGAVLEKHDETESEEDKKNEPEKAAKKRHGWMVTYGLTEVNGAGLMPKLPV